MNDRSQKISLQAVVNHPEKSLFQTAADWKRFQIRYHFEEKDIPHLAGLWEALQGLLQVEAWYRLTEDVPSKNQDAGEVVSESQNAEEALPGKTLTAAVSLGAGLDSLQNLYLEWEEVGDAYGLECIGMAVLEAAYRELQPIVHEKTGFWMKRMIFTQGWEESEKKLQFLGKIPVELTESGMFLPKKSVLFTASLTKKRAESSCHICDNCSLLSCSNRVETGWNGN